MAGFGVPVDARAARRRAVRRAGRCPTLDLLNLPRPRSAAPWAYVKIAEGCDRACGFCAIPSSADRSAAATWRRSSPRSTSSGAARSCSSPRTWPATARTVRASSAPAPSCRWSRRCGERVRTDPAALPVPVRPDRRADRRHRRRAACRTSTSRCSTCRSRCCGGCGAGATATGSCAASTTSARRYPDAAFRSQLHRRLPGRDRGGPRPAAATSSRRPSSTGAASSPTARRTAPTRPDLDGAGRPTADGRAAGRAARAAGRDHRGAPRRAHRRRPSTCSSTRPGRPAVTGRRPRSTASSRCQTPWPWGSSHDVRRGRRARAGPGGRAAHRRWPSVAVR